MLLCGKDPSREFRNWKVYRPLNYLYGELPNQKHYSSRHENPLSISCYTFQYAHVLFLCIHSYPLILPMLGLLHYQENLQPIYTSIQSHNPRSGVGGSATKTYLCRVLLTRLLVAIRRSIRRTTRRSKFILSSASLPSPQRLLCLRRLKSCRPLRTSNYTPIHNLVNRCGSGRIGEWLREHLIGIRYLIQVGFSALPV